MMMMIMMMMMMIDKQVGQIEAAIVLECSEQRLRQKLLQRDPQQSSPDDTTLAVESRLKIFHTETVTVVKSFESKGLLTAVRSDDFSCVSLDLCTRECILLSEYGMHLGVVPEMRVWSLL